MGTRYSAPAFPAAGVSGLSKREYVAAAVLAAIAPQEDMAQQQVVDQLQPGPQPRVKRWANCLARVAVTLADALLKELGSDQVDGEGPLSDKQPQDLEEKPFPMNGETIDYGAPPATDADGDDESGVDLGNLGEGNP